MTEEIPSNHSVIVHAPGSPFCHVYKMAFPATLVQKLEKDAEKPEEGTDKMFRYLVENGASLIEDDPRHGLFAYTTLGFEENRLTIIDRYSTTERRWMPSRFKK